MLFMLPQVEREGGRPLACIPTRPSGLALVHSLPRSGVIESIVCILVRAPSVGRCPPPVSPGLTACARLARSLTNGALSSATTTETLWLVCWVASAACAATRWPKAACARHQAATCRVWETSLRAAVGHSVSECTASTALARQFHRRPHRHLLLHRVWASTSITALCFTTRA